jgi:hypothetical protein
MFRSVAAALMLATAMPLPVLAQATQPAPATTPAGPPKLVVAIASTSSRPICSSEYRNRASPAG